MREQKPEDYLSGNLTAMIDVVFQLIIFFVITIALQDQSMNSGIELAMAPHGKANDIKDLREIMIDVNKYGHISVMRSPLSPNELTLMLTKCMGESQGRQIPIIIRGDTNARHTGIKAVMDACATAGIYKIKFSALKERGRR
jgi:biopolymer transport protein ExbD